MEKKLTLTFSEFPRKIKSSENCLTFQLSRAHIKLLNRMYYMAIQAILVHALPEKIFQIGYHAKPSLSQLHLHVISTDFDSNTMKSKKHWNSFTTELFIPHHST